MISHGLDSVLRLDFGECLSVKRFNLSWFMIMLLSLGKPILRIADWKPVGFIPYGRGSTV